MIDLPPGTGDVQLSLAQSIALAGAIIVTTPQDVALADVVKGAEMFHQLQVPIIGVIENMSYFVCTDCRKRHEIFAHGGGRRLSEKLGVPFLGEVPLDASAREGGDAGKPVILSHPDAPSARAFTEIAGAVQTRLEQLPKAPPANQRVFKADPSLPVLN